jgi:hypothetical protein
MTNDKLPLFKKENYMEQPSKTQIYAALKLIENLYKKKQIPKYMFKNIIEEYKNYIDTTDFKCYTETDR